MRDMVEVGLGKSAQRGFHLDDIAIVPTRRTRDVDDVSTAWQLDAYRFGIPCVAHPSDATMSIFRHQLASVSAAPPQVPAGALATQVNTASGAPGMLDAVFVALGNEGMALPVVSAESSRPGRTEP